MLATRSDLSPSAYRAVHTRCDANTTASVYLFDDFETQTNAKRMDRVAKFPEPPAQHRLFAYESLTARQRYTRRCARQD